MLKILKVNLNTFVTKMFFKMEEMVQSLLQEIVNKQIILTITVMKKRTLASDTTATPNG